MSALDPRADPDNWLTRKEAARLLKVSETTFGKLLKERDSDGRLLIVAYKMSERRRGKYYRPDIEELLKKPISEVR